MILYVDLYVATVGLTILLSAMAWSYTAGRSREAKEWVQHADEQTGNIHHNGEFYRVLLSSRYVTLILKEIRADFGDDSTIRWAQQRSDCEAKRVGPDLRDCQAPDYPCSKDTAHDH